ncbi:MAG: TonB-dependent receptor [Bacteroidetes bacterium]|nr:MAG: TonB-dependent receptor [Bacteroidota bacterium]
MNNPMRKKMMIKKVTLFAFLLITTILTATSQQHTQTIRGSVYDKMNNEPLPGATIIIINSNPLVGAISDLDGNFALQQVPVGRHNLQMSMVGYESFIISELLVSTGREIVLNTGLMRHSVDLGEVVVRVNKDVPLNSMTTLSSRQFTVEETNRYAGGMDDPARLASAFAGVATPNVTSNGISVRGNSPGGLLWRIEGVEVPNPNHFANLTVVGGGVLTALSSQMMGNSDFFTGAFPAEYGNASSGVFDIRLRTGNSSRREFTMQAGVLGVDFAAEGPFMEGKQATYLMNYRYSALGLISPLLPDDAGLIKYQDFAFNTSLPTKKAGTFSVWGIGALDRQEMKAADMAEWQSDFDRDNSQTSLYMFASGLSHKWVVGSKTYISSTLSASGNGLNHEEQRLGYDMQTFPQSGVVNNSHRYGLQSSINHNFGERHTHKTGFYFSHLAYNIDIEQSVEEGAVPERVMKESGSSGLLQFFSQSKVSLGTGLTLNAGLHAQYFLLNQNYAIEPRAGLKYDINEKHSIAMGYGMHSRLEFLPVYFVEQNGIQTNKDLDLMQSTHYVLAWNVKLGEHLRMSIEPYYQSLSKVPVAPDSYISTINVDEDIFFRHVLVSEGKGRNIGVDFTLEQFLHKGMYFLLTGSVFDSRYTAADNIQRNTRFNKNYVFNGLIGKEWFVGNHNNNMLGVNLRINYMGGNRIEPIDNTASLAARDAIYGETNGELAFAKQYADMPVFSFTVSYRRNKPRHASVWSLQVLNVTGAQEFSHHYYDLKKEAIQTNFNGIVLPNLSYRVEF